MNVEIWNEVAQFHFWESIIGFSVQCRNLTEKLALGECPLKFSECPSHEMSYGMERPLTYILTQSCSFPTLVSVCVYLPPSPFVFFMELLDFPVLWAGSVSAGAGQYLLIKQFTEFHSPSDLQGKNMEIRLLLTVCCVVQCSCLNVRQVS
jgi:hypothetical protein